MDITERIRAENEILQLSRVVSQMADTVVITNIDGVIEYVNPAFEQLTGYSSAEALGKTPRLLKSDLHDAGFYERLWSTILHGEVFQDEVINRKKNGDLYYETRVITPIRDAKGKITHFVATGKDVTERKRVEKALRESEERFRAVFESNNAIMLMMESDSGQIVDANPAAVEFYGYAREQLISMNIGEIN